MLSRWLANYFKTKYRISRFARSFRIPDSYTVLDIGSGDSPFPAADVICEKFPWDDRERTARFKHDRPLVVGDIEHLPFKDKAFDFIFCSHVLEHTLHPDQAIAELQRVGKGGYIEVPTSFHEKTVLSYPGHLWFVSREGNNTLVFRQKTSGIVDAEVNEIVKQKLYEKDPSFEVFYYSRLYDLFLIGLYWKNSISCRVERSQSASTNFDKATIDMSHGEIKEARPSNSVGVMKSWIRKYHSRHKKIQLSDLVVCPNCSGALARRGMEPILRCGSCQVNFPIQDEVPVLLKEAASPALR